MQLDAAGHDWERVLQAVSLQAGPDGPHDTADELHDPLKNQIARAIAGCDHACAGLLREIEHPCYRFCLSLLANPDAARDATQETALRVLRSLAKYRGDAAFTTWALSIALNVCREHRRRKRLLGLSSVIMQADPAAGPDERAQANDHHARLHAQLDRLPTRQREAVTLRYLHQLSTAETAKAMRCAEGTVKATLAKALARLRRDWEASDAR